MAFLGALVILLPVAWTCTPQKAGKNLVLIFHNEALDVLQILQIIRQLLAKFRFS